MKVNMIMCLAASTAVIAEDQLREQNVVMATRSRRSGPKQGKYFGAKDEQWRNHEKYPPGKKMKKMKKKFNNKHRQGGGDIESALREFFLVVKSSLSEEFRAEFQQAEQIDNSLSFDTVFDAYQTGVLESNFVQNLSDGFVGTVATIYENNVDFVNIFIPDREGCIDPNDPNDVLTFQPNVDCLCCFDCDEEVTINSNPTLYRFFCTELDDANGNVSARGCTVCGAPKSS